MKKLPFVLANDGIAAGEAVQCFNPNSAVMKAEAFSCTPGNVGALAFSRSGDSATADFGDAELIRKFGDVPDDLTTLWPRSTFAANWRGCVCGYAPSSGRLRRCDVPMSQRPRPGCCSRMRAKIDDLRRQQEQHWELDRWTARMNCYVGNLQPMPGAFPSGPPRKGPNWLSDVPIPNETPSVGVN